ncbi:MAG: type II toxin-antitoxin system antitoxin SocA domain-containing protein, partial [Pseudobdellovibrio sp.]
MKLYKIKVPEFNYSDEFGSFVIQDVEILFDPDLKEITPENFNPTKDEFLLDSEEIERLQKISAERFYDENALDVIKGKMSLSHRHISGIKEYLKVSGAELGTLIGLDKSSISRLLSGKQEPQKDKMMLLLERFKDELDHPNKNRMLLETILSDNRTTNKNIEAVCLSANVVGEYFIRKFNDTESPITNLKLQKLLYYAQGVAFGRANIKLIKEPLLAWEHGPVIRECYDNHKHRERNPVEVNDKLNIDILTENPKVLPLLEETISL